MIPKGRLALDWMGKDLSLVPSEQGKYGYTWVETQDPRASEVRRLETVEHVGDTGDGGSHDNLLITGESGDALRALVRVPELADRYRGKVKLVYIDPPFNTSQTFEHYEDSLEHSVWLTMMRDRLVLIKELLHKDGSVWVHLDDAEVHRMRCVLDEVFGAHHFLGEITWEKRVSRENRAAFSDADDTILVYGNKTPTEWKAVRNKLPRTSLGKNPDNDPRGPWDSIPFSAQGHRPNQMYSITTPTGVVHEPPRGRCWGAVEVAYKELLEQDKIYFPRGGDGRPRVKQFVAEAEGLVPSTLWLAAEVGDNDSAKKQIMEMFPDVRAFDTPKPERLLQRVLHIGSDPGDIVLDCFGGSGTTAAVAHKMGRSWVTAELLPGTVETFTRPRLERVVAGADPSGITTTTERTSAEEIDLPEGMTPDQAVAFRSSLRKVAQSADGIEVDVVAKMAGLVKELDKADVLPFVDAEKREFVRLLDKLGTVAEPIDVTADAVKAWTAATKTSQVTSTHWHGGGGFDVAVVAPSMYQIADDGEVELSPAARHDEFSSAIAGQLGYRITPADPVFAGVKGRMRLAVIDGVMDEHAVRLVVSRLEERQKVMVVAKASTAEAEALLRELSPGSRFKNAPAGLFGKGTVA